MNSTNDPDEALAARARDGDSEAFGVLAARHVRSARRAAQSVLLNPDDADDAVQDGLLAAWRGIAGYDPERPFRPWLLRIVVNAARDFARRRRVRQTEQLPPERATGRPGPDVQAERAELRARLQQALATLPERQRTIAVLFEVEGYAHAEIAALLGMPEGTVRSDLFHARRRLRAILGPVTDTERQGTTP